MVVVVSAAQQISIKGAYTARTLSVRPFLQTWPKKKWSILIRKKDSYNNTHNTDTRTQQTTHNTHNTQHTTTPPHPTKHSFTMQDSFLMMSLAYDSFSTFGEIKVVRIDKLTALP